MAESTVLKPINHTTNPNVRRMLGLVVWTNPVGSAACAACVCIGGSKTVSLVYRARRFPSRRRRCQPLCAAASRAVASVADRVSVAELPWSLVAVILLLQYIYTHIYISHIRLFFTRQSVKNVPIFLGASGQPALRALHHARYGVYQKQRIKVVPVPR